MASIALLLAVSPLVGLWGSERVFPQVHGELIVDGASARIAGFTVPVHTEGATLRFELPGGRGEFRGQRSKGGTIRGHFVQPMLLSFGSRFATPVALLPAGNGVLRGAVAPLEDRFELYLEVREEAGKLTAVLRNPDFNFGRGRPLRVEQDGAAVRFSDAAGAVRKAALEGERLILEEDVLDRGGGSVVLTRRSRDDAPGFYARTPAAPYVFRLPAPGGDGWTTAAPAQAGLDPARLQALVQRILDAAPEAPPWVQGVLVARHRKLVLEEYFYGFSSDRLHDLRSAGKTFTTTLLGAAIDHGAPIDLHASALSFFSRPEPGPKRAITVEHLLTMSTGLACDDDDESSPGNEDTMQQQTAQPDWYAYTLDLPLLHAPGTFAAYCSATMNLAGGVVRRATGRWLPDLFAELIAGPLQIERYALNLAPDGDQYMAGGIRLRPRDFIKLGQAFLDGGTWNGRRLVGAAWVERATSPHAVLNNGNTDGYNWWIKEIGGVHTFAAGGAGGQFVYVAPKLDLVVAFTGGTYGNFRLAQKFAEELLTSYVFPAAKP